jgi:pyruvate/2-oxoglutarate/acetoin dehydrogenase E1 component
MDTLINQATKYWFLTGGRQSCPLVIRSVVGAGGRFGAIHSQMPVSWLMGITGLKIVTPSTPADAKGLLKAAIRDDNPVVFLEHKRLYSTKGEVNGGVAELGRAHVVREGGDVTLVSAMEGVHDCLEAADRLAEHGVSAEVIDLRTLRPIDVDTVLRSVVKTNRVAVVEEGPLPGGGGGRGACARHRGGARRPRRRLADHDSKHAHPVQPPARGCVPTGPGTHRRRGPRPPLSQARPPMRREFGELTRVVDPTR